MAMSSEEGTVTNPDPLRNIPSQVSPNPPKNSRTFLGLVGRLRRPARTSRTAPGLRFGLR